MKNKKVILQKNFNIANNTKAVVTSTKQMKNMYTHTHTHK